MTSLPAVPSAVLAAVASPGSVRGLLQPPPVPAGQPARPDNSLAGGSLADRAVAIADRLALHRELHLPAGSVVGALRLLPAGAELPPNAPDTDELTRLTAAALGALGDLLPPGDPLRAGLLIAARGPLAADPGDTFDEQTPGEWQRHAWRLAVAVLLTAGSAAGAALDDRVADAIQSATSMIGALAVLAALRPPRPPSDPDSGE